MADQDAPVRAGTQTDLGAVNDIYNHYVGTSAATFDLEPVTTERRREWFEHYSDTGPHRLLVADIGGRIVGYATSSRFRPRPAYVSSVETSVYVSPEATGDGIGTALYRALFDELAGKDVHRAYAGITLPNPPSVRLHERFGFVQVGLFSEVGYKFGRYWDVAWFEKRL